MGPSNSFSEFPSAFGIGLRVLMYTAGVVLSALGGFRAYRGFPGVPLSREEAKAERFRDEMIFGEEDTAKLDGPRDDAAMDLKDGAAKPASGSAPEAGPTRVRD
jgi:hypothetical protein